MIFTSPIINKKYQWIKLAGFICANHSLRLDGKLVRRLNCITILFDVDRLDECASKQSCEEWIADAYYDFEGKSRKKIHGIKMVQKELFGIILEEVDRLALYNHRRITFFARDIYLNSGEMYFFYDICKSEKKEHPVTLEMSVRKKADNIIESIKNFYHEPFYKVGRVNDGGRKYSR